jgi:hypothetical protein
MEVGVERGSAGFLFFRRFLVLFFFAMREPIKKEAVLAEIQNRLDPTLALPQNNLAREF